MAQTTRETTRPVAVSRPAGGVRRWDALSWGPIFAGLIVTVATLVLMTILGAAIGLTADPVLAGEFDLGTAATVWGIITAVVAFLLGGMVAGATAKPTTGAGTLNGAMVGAFAIAAVTLSAALGIGNLLGAGAANLGQIAEIAPALETEEAVEFARAQADDAEIAAWVTFFSLLGAIIVAAIGGLLGARSTEAVVDDDRPAMTERDRESTV
jgi:hypothetical protein